MTDTQIIRELLDNRGIKWKASGGTYVSRTTFVARGIEYTYEEVDGKTRLSHEPLLGVTPERAIEVALGPVITEDTSDGWHTFKDLYHHRALLFSVIVHDHKELCWKSKRHHDGKELDWNFIVGIDTPWGQASYHYGMEYWDLFDCKVLDKAPYYDGYTAEESVSRIARLAELCGGAGVSA